MNHTIGSIRSSLVASLCTALLVAGLQLFHPLSAMAAEIPDNVCIQCHGKLPGRTGEPVNLWKGSIHAENGIVCNSCHGGDPKDAVNAMNPARGFLGKPKEPEIPAFCGRCHVGVKNDYLLSAHGRALGKGGPTCVTCHGNHRVVRASLDLINEKTCSQCHSYDRARLIRNAMQETEAMISALDARITGFRQVGVDTDRLEKNLFALRNQYRSLFHSVEVDKVRNESARLQSELKKIDLSIQRLNEAKIKRKLVGAALIAVTLIAALLAYLLRSTYD